MNEATKQPAPVQGILFEGIFDKPVLAAFDAPSQTSDGGALLIGGLDYTLGLCRRLAGALKDPRQIGKVEHQLEEMLRFEVYKRCCGYEDVNDADRLRQDPLLKFLCALSPEAKQLGLASASTLNRMENVFGWRDLLRAGRALMDWQLEHQARIREQKVRLVTIDLDPTDDPAYGQQYFSFFNGHYDNYVFLPLLSFVTFHDEHGNEEAEQFLVSALLRPGNAAPVDGARGTLRRLIRRLREVFPGIAIRVRLDGGFACPEMLDFLEAQGVKYLVNLPPNSVLRTMAAELMERAEKMALQSGQSARVYGECEYAAGSWADKKRRVIIKAEILLHNERGTKENARFVVTNYSPAAEPERLYKGVYCVRGDTENRIKELHAMALGRTSCTSFWANHFRVLLAAGAYMLMQELRRRLKGSALERAQVWRLREVLLKVGATVREVTRRVYLSLPASAVFANLWRRVALSLGTGCGALS